MLKRILIAALMWPLLVLAQSYPSPTFQNLTVLGTFTGTGNIGLSTLAAQAANTVVANVTGSSASPTAVAIPSCSAVSSAIQYTSGTGFSCGSSFAATNSTNTWSALQTFNSGITATGTLTGFPGRLLNVQVFTASGTYTPTSGANTAIVEVIGGGGGGGGSGAATGSTVAVAQGGSSGSYAKVRLTSLSSQTVTIGGGGAGGAAGANAGASGGQTTFGSIITCPGGLGGQGASAQTPPFFFGSSGPGAVCTTTATAIILSHGQTGNIGITLTLSDSIGGAGAASVFGGGPGPVATTSSPGGSAVSKGAGGGGAITTPSGSAQAGGNGAPGVVIVWEYQ